MDDLVKTNETSGLIPFKEVEDKIAIIRNQQVIADADVAALYGVQTKEVNQAVRNNPDKFPKTYMFELNENELLDLRSKILTTKVSKKSRSATKVFTDMTDTVCHRPAPSITVKMKSTPLTRRMSPIGTAGASTLSR